VAFSSKQKKVVRKLTDDVLRRLLGLKVTYDLTCHRIDEGRSRWRELEEQLHSEEYPVKGSGIIATPSNLGKLYAEDGGFLHNEEDVSPEDMVANLGQFPLAAASASYAFTILECFGDEVVRIVNPTFAKERKAWHRDVFGDLDRMNDRAIRKAMSGFARPFRAKFFAVIPISIIRLIALKNARNEYAHRGVSDINFEDFFGFTLGVVCQIYFLCLPEETELKAFPWEALDEKWRRL
jgi:hypothetical protein